MRVAFMCGRFPTLAETPTLNIATGLVQRDHDVQVFAGGPQPGVAPHPDAERFRLGERTHYRPRYAPGIGPRADAVMATLRAHNGADRRALLRSLNPLRFWWRATSLDVFGDARSVLEHGPFDVAYGAFGVDGKRCVRLQQAGALPVPVLTSFRGSDLLVYPRSGGRNYYRALFRRGAFFLPVCRAFVPHLEAQGCPPDRIRVHPTGIDISRHPFNPRTPPTAGETLRLCSVARLIESKGIQVALRTVRSLIDCGRAVQYTVAGNGPFRPALEQEIERLGLQAHVTLAGSLPQKEVIALLQRSHVMLAPSFRSAKGAAEGIPNVLKEAMAVGVPVVASELEGIPELVTHDATGLLVPPGDDAALAASVRSLLQAPERWPALIHAGRRVVETEYDINVLNDRLVGMFREAIAMGKG